MKKIEMKVLFPRDGGVVTLELYAPLRSEAVFGIWTALARARINPLTASLHRTARRLVARVQVTEYDGSRVSQLRAAELLGTLQRCITVRSVPEDAAGPVVAA